MDYEILHLKAGCPELEAGSDLCRHWDDLVRVGDHGDPYCCGSDWNVPFHKVFTPEQEVVAFVAEGALVIFTLHPLADGATVFHSLESGWLYANPVLGPNGVPLLVEIMPELARIADSKFFLMLSALRPGRPQALQIMRAFGRITRILRRNEVLITAGADLTGGFDGWLSRRSANQRAKARKALRRALRRGVTFERRVPRDDEEAREVYRRVVAIENTSWKGRGHCGMTEQPYCDFYGDMMLRLTRMGRARVIFARCDDQDIGFVYGGMCGDYYRGQQFSYNDDWHQWSIGNIMQVEQVKWLCEEGALRYDVGAITGPRMEYKEHWTDFQAPLETWFLLP